LTDACQRSAPSFILQVATGGSTSWPGPALVASVSFVFVVSLAISPEKRFLFSWFLTVIASAFRWPIKTRNLLPQVLSV
jgi:hypothetical protein